MRRTKSYGHNEELNSTSKSGFDNNIAQPSLLDCHLNFTNETSSVIIKNYSSNNPNGVSESYSHHILIPDNSVSDSSLVPPNNTRLNSEYSALSASKLSDTVFNRSVSTKAIRSGYKELENIEKKLECIELVSQYDDIGTGKFNDYKDIESINTAKSRRHTKISDVIFFRNSNIIKI